MAISMSQNNNNSTDHTSDLNLVNIFEETVNENLTKCLYDALTEIKKCLDKVLDLRVHTAELEVCLTTMYNPSLLKSLEEIENMTHLMQEESVENS